MNESTVKVQGEPRAKGASYCMIIKTCILLIKSYNQQVQNVQKCDWTVCFVYKYKHYFPETVWSEQIWACVRSFLSDIKHQHITSQYFEWLFKWRPPRAAEEGQTGVMWSLPLSLFFSCISIFLFCYFSLPLTVHSISFLSLFLSLLPLSLSHWEPAPTSLFKEPALRTDSFPSLK